MKSQYTIIVWRSYILTTLAGVLVGAMSALLIMYFLNVGKLIIEMHSKIEHSEIVICTNK